MTMPVQTSAPGALAGLLPRSTPNRGRTTTLKSSASSAHPAACVQVRYGSRNAKISMDMCTILRVEKSGARGAATEVEISGMFKSN